MKKVMRRTERTKTIVINPEDLKDIISLKKENAIEEKLIVTLKEYMKSKKTISDELTEKVIKRVMKLIDSVEKEINTDAEAKLQPQTAISENENHSEHIQTSSVQPQQKYDNKKPRKRIVTFILPPQIIEYDNTTMISEDDTATSSSQPQEENCLAQQSIPTEVINSTIKIQNLAQTFEHVIDGVLTMNACCNKNDIILERTFDFQSLLGLFERK